MDDKKGSILSQFEHVYRRPDMYIGAVETIHTQKWVWNDEKSSAELKSILFNPGLFSIIREIGSNVIDNKWRSEKDPSGNLMKKIIINTDLETGEISFLNDGYTIPVHKETYSFTSFKKESYNLDLYPAEVFFGHMGAGTNFDDSKERKTSGKNGMGAKVSVVFSKEFTVEHTCPEDQAKFVQKHWNNGKEYSEPNVTKCTRKTGYTKISFIPDYSRFGYPTKDDSRMDETLVSVIRMYAYEISMLTGIPVQFNGQKLNIRTLEDYARIFYPNSDKNKTAHLKSSSGDECVIVEKLDFIKDEVDKIDHVSFINGIQTFGGGIHVDAWEKAIITPFVKLFNQRKKDALKTTGNLVKPYFTLFIRSEIDKPQFESNNKSQLVGPCDAKGKPMYVVRSTNDFKVAREAVFKKMMKWNFIVLLEEKLEAKAERGAKKNEVSKLISNKNITHANKAGTSSSSKCILCITEGLSAKGFMDTAIGEIRRVDESGNEIIGTDYYGSMAIRGKFMNVQNASLLEISKNNEIQLLKNALGLRQGIDYSKKDMFKKLRYGSVWIVTDADDDGIHIRALLINFFYQQFRTLFDRGYIKAFNTPVVKIYPRSKRDKDKRERWRLFYTYAEFQRWQNQNSDLLRNQYIQYYKGLGSIPSKESDFYLVDPKIVTYYLQGDESDYMSLGFDKNDTDRRKRWIKRGMLREVDLFKQYAELTSEEDDSDSEEASSEEPEFIYDGRLSLSSFVDNQLIIYHRMTLRRHLPCIWDGFTESQRKAFYGIRKAKLSTSQTLGRLAGEIQRDTAYHHGPESLMKTIIRMAQGFVGSNNIPLLVPNGNFGKRCTGGKDHAAPRYPSTMLENIVNVLFPEVDDALLTQLEDTDGPIEYSTYYPIIPMLLVNGASGLACGSSTEIPCYNPEDIVDWLVNRLKGKTYKKELIPWYRGFVGEIEMVTPKGSDFPTGWISKGILEKGTGKDKGWWHIRELPIGLWSNKFKEHLDFLQSGVPPKGSRRKKSIKCIKKYRNYNKKNTVHFMIKPSNSYIPDMTVSGNMKLLQKKHNLKNLVVIDEKNYPYRFQRPEQILDCFYQKRLEIYSKRKEHLLKVYQKDLRKASNRYKFVCVVGIERTLNLHSFGTDEELYDCMKKEYDFDLVDNSYDYLLNMSVRSLTKKKAQELDNQRQKLKDLISNLEEKSPKDLWLEDLKEFRIEYRNFLKQRDD